MFICKQCNVEKNELVGHARCRICLQFVYCLTCSEHLAKELTEKFQSTSQIVCNDCVLNPNSVNQYRQFRSFIHRDMDILTSKMKEKEVEKQLFEKKNTFWKTLYLSQCDHSVLVDSRFNVCALCNDTIVKT